MSVIISPMQQHDIEAVASIHSRAFIRQQQSTQWIRCNFAAYPRIMMFVAKDEQDCVVGYIQWIHKSGFRSNSIIELEQIAVINEQQGNGIGTLLIKKSIEQIKDYLSSTNSTLKAVMVTTRTDNAAQQLYHKALGAEAVSIIKDLYSHDEVIMLAREL